MRSLRFTARAKYYQDPKLSFLLEDRSVDAIPSLSILSSFLAIKRAVAVSIGENIVRSVVACLCCCCCCSSVSFSDALSPTSRIRSRPFGTRTRKKKTRSEIIRRESRRFLAKVFRSPEISLGRGTKARGSGLLRDPSV